MNELTFVSGENVEGSTFSLLPKDTAYIHVGRTGRVVVIEYVSPGQLRYGMIAKEEYEARMAKLKVDWEAGNHRAPWVAPVPAVDPLEK